MKKASLFLIGIIFLNTLFFQNVSASSGYLFDGGVTVCDLSCANGDFTQSPVGITVAGETDFVLSPAGFPGKTRIEMTFSAAGISDKHILLYAYDYENNKSEQTVAELTLKAADESYSVFVNGEALCTVPNGESVPLDFDVNLSEGYVNLYF